MMPGQEINIFMSNGDVAKALLQDLGGKCRADFHYQSSRGPKLNPIAGPVGSAIECFEHMTATISRLGAIYGSSIVRISNPNNSDLISVPDQMVALAHQGASTYVERKQ